MVMLRSNGDMDSSTEFLSLNPPQRKSARLKKAHDDSITSVDDSPVNVRQSFFCRSINMLVIKCLLKPAVNIRSF